MAGFKLRISGVGSDPATNFATSNVQSPNEILTYGAASKFPPLELNTYVNSSVGQLVKAGSRINSNDDASSRFVNSEAEGK